MPADETFQYADNMMLLAEAVGIARQTSTKSTFAACPSRTPVFDFEAFWKNQIPIPKEKA